MMIRKVVGSVRIVGAKVGEKVDFSGSHTANAIWTQNTPSGELWVRQRPLVDNNVIELRLLTTIVELNILYSLTFLYFLNIKNNQTILHNLQIMRICHIQNKRAKDSCLIF